MKFAILAVIAAGIAAPAFAQGVDQRQDNQERRIEQGERSGALTRGEANRLDRQQNRIDRAEDRDRAAHDGRLTRGERARLEARENRASAHIYRAKHNGRVR